MPKFSRYSQTITPEIAFNVLALARQLKAGGKRVIELEIGDSPFPTTPAAARAGIAGIERDVCHYGPSAGLPEMRAAASEYVNANYGLQTTTENIVVGPGAKTFQLFFAEAFLNPGDSVLVFSPNFTTYVPCIQRAGARVVFAPLRQEHEFRPQQSDVDRFLREEASPRAIFLNSPHNPTGGVATRDDLAGIADLIRGRDVALFSDEPYDRMVWRGTHHSILAQPGMLEQCTAVYTFSKSYSMSGWRLGFAVASRETAALYATLVNVYLSCVPPFVQLAGVAALREDGAERDRRMKLVRAQVELLVNGLNRIEGMHCLDPAGAFYLFPSVKPICNRLGITSHGLAMYFLEAADDALGVACLGGECFGEAGAGFLRFSCAQPNEQLEEALQFIPEALAREERLQAYLAGHQQYRLAKPYG